MKADWTAIRGGEPGGEDGSQYGSSPQACQKCTMRCYRVSAVALRGRGSAGPTVHVGRPAYFPLSAFLRASTISSARAKGTAS